MALFPVELEISFCGKYELLPPGPNQMGFGWEQEYFIIEYCTSGKGLLTIHNHSYLIEAGQCFATFPGVPYVLLADELDPWGTAWACFRGATAMSALKQAGVSERSPVFPWRDKPVILNCLNTLIAQYGDEQPSSELRRMSNAYRLLSELVLLNEAADSTFPAESQQVTKTGNYVFDAIEYMKHNYHKKIRIADISQYVGLNRCYFSSLFRDCIGVSPQQYLIHLRIRIACDCLDNPLTSISSIARTVGYEPLVFSQLFHQIMGMSPSAYRNLPKPERIALKSKQRIGELSDITKDATHNE